MAELGERLDSGEGRTRSDSVRLANIRAVLYPKRSEERRLVEAMLLAAPRLAVPESDVAYVITPHARVQMHRRGIDEDVLHRVMTAPEQQFDLRPGRAVRQSLVGMGGRAYLVRVVVDVERTPAEVVTVYRTTKISKYWRE